jgi:hypothetical protein
VPAIDAFQRAIEQAMRGSIAKTAKVAENFVARNEAPMPASEQPPRQPAQASPAARPANAAGPAGQVRGYLMEEENRSRPAQYRPTSVAGSNGWAAAGVTLPVLAGLMAWRQTRRRRR